MIRVQEYTDVAKNSKQRGITIRGNFDVRARVRGWCAYEFDVRLTIDHENDRRSSGRSGRSWTFSGNDGRRRRCVWRATVCLA